MKGQGNSQPIAGGSPGHGVAEVPVPVEEEEEGEGGVERSVLQAKLTKLTIQIGKVG